MIKLACIAAALAAVVALALVAVTRTDESSGAAPVVRNAGGSDGHILKPHT